MTTHLLDELEENIRCHIKKIGSCDTEKSYGLFKGKVGTSVLYNVLYRYTGDSSWNAKVERIIEEVTNNINISENFGYADGFTGIGWCIEWLVQNKSFNANTDEVLEEFDDCIYKLVLYSLDKNISLRNGTIGKSVYFLKRTDGVNFQTHRFKIICLQECLVILTDEMLMNISEAINSLRVNWMDKDHLTNLAHTVIFLSKFAERKINIEVVEEALYLSVNYAEEILTKLVNIYGFQKMPNGLKKSLMMLAYAYQFCGLKLNISAWINNGTQHLNSFLKLLLESTCPHERLYVFPILARQYYCQNDELYVKLILDNLRHLDYTSIDNGLHNGSYGLLLSAIGCMKYNFLNWDEALLLS